MIEIITLANKIKIEAQINLPGIEAHKIMLPEGRNIPNYYLNKIGNLICFSNKFKLLSRRKFY